MAASHPNHQDQQLKEQVSRATMKQVKNTSQPVPTSLTRVTEDRYNFNLSNGAEPQPSDTRSVGQNTMESTATGMLSPPPSRPGTPELPPAPSPSPTVGARDKFLSRPCMPNYSLHVPLLTPSGGKRNGEANTIRLIRSLPL